MSYTIHLLTRQPFPAKLRLRATWDDPDDPLRGRGAFGVTVGLSEQPVRELSTAKLQEAVGKVAGEDGAGDRWTPASRVYVDKGSPIAHAVAEALLDALGGVMVLDGWVDDYADRDSLFGLNESTPPAKTAEQLRAVFKATIAGEKKLLKKRAEARQKELAAEFQRKRAEAAEAFAAELEKEGDEPPPPIVLATEGDHALYEAVRPHLGDEAPLLLGLASHTEYGVQRGLATCLTATRLLLVPVDVATEPPAHRFAAPLRVSGKPGAKPAHHAKRDELCGLAFHPIIGGAPMISLGGLMLALVDADASAVLSNQGAFRQHLCAQLARGNRTWKTIA